ncbi:MAG: hypothetical protein FJ317_05235 [SAR202 cluster bacterium]|nr:hypothetical protein [SAR202 cluster bacterium]
MTAIRDFLAAIGAGGLLGFGTSRLIAWRSYNEDASWIIAGVITGFLLAALWTLMRRRRNTKK